MNIRTNNMNGFCHTRSNKKFRERLLVTFALSQSILPDIWAMQEIPGGGKDLPCLSYLKRISAQCGYKMIMPAKLWNPNGHPKSIQNVLLLKDNAVEEFEVLTLGKEVALPNRYNYVKVRLTESPDTLYILNFCGVQTTYFPGHDLEDSYVQWRKEQARELFDALIAEVEKLLSVNERQLIVLGDFNESLTGVNMQRLSDLGLQVPNKEQKDKDMFFHNGTRKYEPIDFILVSPKVKEKYKLGGYTIDTDLVKKHKVTDHATVEMTLQKL